MVDNPAARAAVVEDTIARTSTTGGGRKRSRLRIAVEDAYDATTSPASVTLGQSLPTTSDSDTGAVIAKRPRRRPLRTSEDTHRTDEAVSSDVEIVSSTALASGISDVPERPKSIITTNLQPFVAQQSSVTNKRMVTVDDAGVPTLQSIHASWVHNYYRIYTAHQSAKAHGETPMFRFSESRTRHPAFTASSRKSKLAGADYMHSPHSHHARCMNLHIAEQLHEIHSLMESKSQQRGTTTNGGGGADQDGLCHDSLLVETCPVTVQEHVTEFFKTVLGGGRAAVPSTESKSTATRIGTPQTSSSPEASNYYVCISSKEPTVLHKLLFDSPWFTWLHPTELPCGDFLFMQHKQPLFVTERKTFADYDARYDDWKSQRARLIDTFQNHTRRPIPASHISLLLEYSDLNTSHQDLRTLLNSQTANEVCYGIPILRSTSLLHTILTVTTRFLGILKNRVIWNPNSCTLQFKDQEKIHIRSLLMPGRNAIKKKIVSFAKQQQQQQQQQPAMLTDSNVSSSQRVVASIEGDDEHTAQEVEDMNKHGALPAVVPVSPSSLKGIKKPVTMVGRAEQQKWSINRQIWVSQLSAINGVSLEMAMAISEKYPNPVSLIKAVAIERKQRPNVSNLQTDRLEEEDGAATDVRTDQKKEVKRRNKKPPPMWRCMDGIYYTPHKSTRSMRVGPVLADRIASYFMDTSSGTSGGAPSDGAMVPRTAKSGSDNHGSSGASMAAADNPQMESRSSIMESSMLGVSKTTTRRKSKTASSPRIATVTRDVSKSLALSSSASSTPIAVIEQPLGKSAEISTAIATPIPITIPPAIPIAVPDVLQSSLSHSVEIPSAPMMTNVTHVTSATDDAVTARHGENSTSRNRHRESNRAHATTAKHVRDRPTPAASRSRKNVTRGKNRRRRRSPSRSCSPVESVSSSSASPTSPASPSTRREKRRHDPRRSHPSQRADSEDKDSHDRDDGHPRSSRRPRRRRRERKSRSRSRSKSRSPSSSR